jgi:hypothetical protein
MNIVLFLIITWIFSFIFPILILFDYKFLFIYLLLILITKIFFKYFFNNIHHNYILNSCFNYYSVKFINEAEIDNKSLIACFPHGIFCQGFSILVFLKKNYINFVASILINMPIIGYLLKTYNTKSADKNTFINNMKKNNNLLLLPSGFNEVFMTTKYEYNLYIPTGFIVLCIKNEYNIYPCLFLGENEIFDTITIPKKYWKYCFKLIKIIQIPLNFIYSIIPKKVPIHIIYGKKIKCNKLDSVENIREQIKNQLTLMFDSNIKEYCKLYNFDSTKYKLNIYF